MGIYNIPSSEIFLDNLCNGYIFQIPQSISDFLRLQSLRIQYFEVFCLSNAIQHVDCFQQIPAEVLFAFHSLYHSWKLYWDSFRGWMSKFQEKSLFIFDRILRFYNSSPTCASLSKITGQRLLKPEH